MNKTFVRILDARTFGRDEHAGCYEGSFEISTSWRPRSAEKTSQASEPLWGYPGSKERWQRGGIGGKGRKVGLKGMRQKESTVSWDTGYESVTLKRRG